MPAGWRSAAVCAAVCVRFETWNLRLRASPGLDASLQDGIARIWNLKSPIDRRHGSCLKSEISNLRSPGASACICNLKFPISNR